MRASDISVPRYLKACSNKRGHTGYFVKKFDERRNLCRAAGVLEVHPRDDSGRSDEPQTPERPRPSFGTGRNSRGSATNGCSEG
jgi:hypothetical protein